MGSSRSVRVRFSPSPTGHLHVGNCRTALFNWLFARKHGGTFILRMEDTDRPRSSETFEKGIIEDLQWLGLHWDEGPDVGGAKAPYRQSERMELYRQTAHRLMEKGSAYPCFCSQELLEEKRERQMRRGLPPRYDGECRLLPPDKAMKRLEKGDPHTVRLLLPHGSITLRDMVKGEMTFQSADMDDFILLRSDGTASYNFAAADDDAAMEITHVIRGDDHLSNTPKQVLILKALGSDPPKYAHLPLIHFKPGTPMSKREGGGAVRELRGQGILPSAVINYMALLGWSPGTGKEDFSLDELIQQFTLERVSESPSTFDPDKLSWFNRLHLHRAEACEIWRSSIPFLEGTGMEEWFESADRDRLHSVIEAVKPNMETLRDLPRWLSIFREGSIDISSSLAPKMAEERSLKAIRFFRERLSASDRLDRHSFRVWVEEAEGELGMSLGAILRPLRIALTGKERGPELELIIPLMGRELCLSRLDHALESLRRKSG